MGITQLVTPSERRKKQWVERSVALTPIFAVLSILSLLFSLKACSDTPQPQDVPAEVSFQTEAEQFGRDFMTLWLAGSGEAGNKESANLKALKRMVGDENTPLALPTTPYRVENIDVRTVSTYPLADDPTINEVGVHLQADAFVIAPGTSSASRRTFEFDVMAKDGHTFKVTALPYQTTKIENPYKIEPVYAQVLPKDSPMATSIQAFGTAYLTASKSVGLGSTVGANFTGTAVSNPLWESVELVEARWGSEDVSMAEQNPLESAKPNDTVYVLATFKANSSSTTFSTVQMPLLMVLLENGQWVVDQIEREVYIKNTHPIS